MSIETRDSGYVPPAAIADCEAVIQHVLSRKPLDPEVYRRVRERAERATEDIRLAHGVVVIAVELIRETRDEQ